MDYQKRMSKVMKIYNIELIAEFSGLSGKELEECYIYCNANIKLEELDDDFTIKYKVLEVF